MKMHSKKTMYSHEVCTETKRHLHKNFVSTQLVLTTPIGGFCLVYNSVTFAPIVPKLFRSVHNKLVNVHC